MGNTKWAGLLAMMLSLALLAVASAHSAADSPEQPCKKIRFHTDHNERHLNVNCLECCAKHGWASWIRRRSAGKERCHCLGYSAASR